MGEPVKSAGQVAYEAFRKSWNDRAGSDIGMAPWEHLGVIVQESWQCAAFAVMRAGG